MQDRNHADPSINNEHPPLAGTSRVQKIGLDGSLIEIAVAANTWVYSWGHVVANLAAGRTEYAPAHVYVEYRNLNDPGDPVPIPTINREDGVAYYMGLIGSPGADYMRLSLASPIPEYNSGVPGADSLPPGFHNQLRCQVAAAAGTGALGLPFSFAAGSKIIGTALVASPDPGDRSKDVVWSRAYYPQNQQIVVPVIGGLVVTHLLSFQ